MCRRLLILVLFQKKWGEAVPAQKFLAGVPGSGGSDDGHMEKWGARGDKWRSGGLTTGTPSNSTTVDIVRLQRKHE